MEERKKRNTLDISSQNYSGCMQKIPIDKDLCSLSKFETVFEIGVVYTLKIA